MNHHEAHAAQVDALFTPAEATHVAVNSGDWSNPNTWDTGTVPGEGALVLIQDGKTVTYDVDSSVELEMVRVDGTLSWARDQDTSMHVETILSSHGSHIEIGTLDDPIQANVSAEITFTDGPIDLSVDPGMIGHGLVTFGEVNINGAEKADHLTMNSVKAGATSITVDSAPTGWQPGDQILLVGTEYVGENANGVLQTQDETRTIVSIDGNTVTFDKPLQYDHEPPAGYDFDTYVANLSRNVVLQSENPEGVRGHFMMHNGTTEGGDLYANTVVNAEFRDLGRTDHSRDVGTSGNPEGRYSIHLHEIGTETDSATSLIQGNSVVGNPGWGIVQHSSNAVVSDNVVFDVTGAGIVSEMGDEIGVWNNNLVSSVTGSDQTKQVGSEGAAFENQSRVITQDGNIAANSKIGWNFSGRESFAEDADNPNAPKDGIHRKMFERDQLQFDPSPFDVAIDHEEPPLTDFDNNVSIGTDTAFRVFHRQFSDDTDTMSVIDNFTVWGGRDAIHLDNYASNYQFQNSTLQGDGTGFRIERKTSAVVFNDVEFNDFGTGYRSYGVNHEVVLIDTDFNNVGNEFVLQDLLEKVDSSSVRNELINYFRSEFGIDYTNPMPQIVNSSDLTQVDAVTFKADAGADLTLGPGDNNLRITGTITDSVGVRTFNEYVIAKPPSGSGSSKDFEGINLSFAGSESDSQREFTVNQFLEIHGTYQKADGSWVSPVVNWITDRLTGDQHPVVIEIQLKGFNTSTLQAYELAEYPNPGINNPNFDSGILAGNSGGGHGGHTDGGHTDGGNTDGGHTDGGHTDGGHTDGGNTDGGHTDGGSTDGGHTDGGHTDGGNTDGGHTDGGHTDGGNTGGGHTDGGNTDGGQTPGGLTLTGTVGNDTLRGGADGDDIEGSDGNDKLLGRGDNDTLDGGRGDDRLEGGKGNDVLSGGIGRDALFGNDGADTLDGGSSADQLYGGHGFDLVFGGSGNDKIGGAGGNDTLNGGTGNDTIFGAAGNDRVDGGDGNDKIHLGSGDDLLIFSEGNDRVMDFDTKGDDVLDLSFAAGITDFNDLMANHFEIVGGDAVITDDQGNSLTFDNTAPADLTADDFLF